MRMIATVAAFGCLGLAACGGGAQSAGNEAADVLPGQSVNAADGINVSADASGTTGSTTGDAGGPLNIVADAEADSNEANGAASNEQ